MKMIQTTVRVDIPDARQYDAANVNETSVRLSTVRRPPYDSSPLPPMQSVFGNRRATEFDGGAAVLAMRSEAKHPAIEREIRGTPKQTSHATPGSFAALRMTKSLRGTVFRVHGLPQRDDYRFRSIRARRGPKLTSGSDWNTSILVGIRTPALLA